MTDRATNAEKDSAETGLYKLLTFLAGGAIGTTATVAIAALVIGLLGALDRADADPAVAEASPTPAPVVATDPTTDPTESLAGNAEDGAALVAEFGCAACHSVDGTPGVGPTWLGLAASDRSLADGSSAVADGEYLHSSIVDPGLAIVDGFADAMPKDYGTRMTGPQIEAVIGYIESLGS